MGAYLGTATKVSFRLPERCFGQLPHRQTGLRNFRVLLFAYFSLCLLMPGCVQKPSTGAERVSAPGRNSSLLSHQTPDSRLAHSFIMGDFLRKNVKKSKDGAFPHGNYRNIKMRVKLHMSLCYNMLGF